MTIHSAEEFVRLRDSANPDEYMRAATDSAPDQVWMDVLERFPEYRRWVAQNKSVPPDILAVLAEDSDPEVRWVVASRRSAPAWALERLARDPDETVRSRVVHNAKAPADVLRILREDPSKLIRSVAISRLAEE